VKNVQNASDSKSSSQFNLPINNKPKSDSLKGYAGSLISSTNSILSSNQIKTDYTHMKRAEKMEENIPKSEDKNLIKDERKIRGPVIERSRSNISREKQDQLDNICGEISANPLFQKRQAEVLQHEQFRNSDQGAKLQNMVHERIINKKDGKPDTLVLKPFAKSLEKEIIRRLSRDFSNDQANQGVTTEGPRKPERQNQDTSLNQNGTGKANHHQNLQESIEKTFQNEQNRSEKSSHRKKQNHVKKTENQNEQELVEKTVTHQNDQNRIQEAGNRNEQIEMISSHQNLKKTEADHALKHERIDKKIHPNDQESSSVKSHQNDSIYPKSKLSSKNNSYVNLRYENKSGLENDSMYTKKGQKNPSNQPKFVPFSGKSSIPEDYSDNHKHVTPNNNSSGLKINSVSSEKIAHSSYSNREKLPPFSGKSSVKKETFANLKPVSPNNKSGFENDFIFTENDAKRASKNAKKIPFSRENSVTEEYLTNLKHLFPKSNSGFENDFIFTEKLTSNDDEKLPFSGNSSVTEEYYANLRHVPSKNKSGLENDSTYTDNSTQSDSNFSGRIPFSGNNSVPEQYFAHLRHVPSNNKSGLENDSAYTENVQKSASNPDNVPFSGISNAQKDYLANLNNVPEKDLINSEYDQQTGSFSVRNSHEIDISPHGNDLETQIGPNYIEVQLPRVVAPRMMHNHNRKNDN
jgi:hypothetical protein